MDPFGSPSFGQPVLPKEPAPPPVLGQPTGKKPQRKSAIDTSFLGSVTPASGQLGSKTLVGQ